MFFGKRSLMLGGVALAITAGATMQAQEVTGTLLGTVKDSNGKPMANAYVLIRSPKMIAPRKVVTDENGSYRAPLIPPGEYQIDVTRDGYAGQGARNVRVSVGSNARQDFVLRPIATASTTVEVVATSATADKSDTKASTSLSSEELLTIPTSGGDRAFVGAMDLAPGVTTNAGGGTSIRGGKTQETGYTLNGTSIKDDYEGRMNSTRLIDDAVEDTQVIQSPLHARFGRTGGGMVNVVTKSGGNDFSGSIRSYISRSDWQAQRRYEQSGADGRSDGLSRRQFDIFFSGPIWRDRIWFAVSSIQKPPQQFQDTLLKGEVKGNWTPATPTRKHWSDLEPSFQARSLYAYDIGTTLNGSESQDYIDIKLTGAITGDHTVDFTFQQNDLTITTRNPYGSEIIATIQSNSLAQTQLEKYWSYGYRGVIGGNKFIEARYSKTISEAMFPYPPLDHMRLHYGNTNFGVIFPYGFNLSPKPDSRNNQSGNLNYKHFIEWHGSHEFDAGFEFYEFLRGTLSQNGARNLRFYVPAAVDMSDVSGWAPDPYGHMVGFQAVNFDYSIAQGLAQGKTTQIISNMIAPRGQSAVLRKYLGADGVAKNRTTAFYANDAWTVNEHLNLMLGLRVDRFRVVDTDQTVLIEKTGPLAPRLQVRYDIDGTTKHVITFTGAKYVTEFGAGFTGSFIKMANSNYVDYGYTGVANAAGAAKYVDYANITNVDNYKRPFNFFASSRNNVLEEFSNPYVMEYTLGYRRNYANGSFFQLTTVNKEWKNDFSIVQDIGPEWSVMNPDPTNSGMAPIEGAVTRYGNSSALKRTYKAFELEFQHNINSTFLFGGNYTYSRLKGNHNGGDQTGQSFFDPAPSAPLTMKNQFSKFGTPTARYAPEGFLLSHQAHKARAYVTASLPLGKGRISYSAMLRYDSGSAFGANANELLPSSAQNPIPSYASPLYTSWFTQRGAFTNNDTFQVDAKIDWSMPLGFKKLQLMGYLQIENVFNTQKQELYNSNFWGGELPYMATSLPVSDPRTFGTDEFNFDNYIRARNIIGSIGLKF